MTQEPPSAWEIAEAMRRLHRAEGAYWEPTAADDSDDRRLQAAFTAFARLLARVPKEQP